VSRGPDPARARAAYDRHARRYDDRLTVLMVEALQRAAIERLELAPGERALDVACGTGLAFGPIEAAIGQAGALTGVDLSGAMLQEADDRVRAHGWSNVRLVEGRVEDADLGEEPFDAALFSFAHDVLQSDAAVDRVVGALRPGGRVAATGISWAPRWNLPVNAAVLLGTRRYVTTFAGLGRPWRRLAERLVDVRVGSRRLGSMYVMSGRAPT
jgi:demethylmenaquinone methyltransferase/2-methoxy-6-polyprenyl-1,4-benzoquinol methylase